MLDDELRERVALLYRGFRDMYGGVVGSEGGLSADELHALETLMIAVVDGLAVQKLLDPDAVRLDVVLPFWENVLQLVFAPSRRRDAAAGRASAPDAARGHARCPRSSRLRRAPRGWCTPRPARR